jgi:ubiquinone/menaquinone biosynthesis C-methylase UbiE/rhodanese-related sulfurtransferase
MSSEIHWAAVAEVAHNFGSMLWQANDKFIELGNVSPDSMILDLGCGSGSLSRQLSSRMAHGQGKVIGVDTSPEMIETAKRASPESDKLKLHVHDAHELRFKDEVCDVVFCRHALPFFASPEGVLARSLAVLKPGGRLAVMGVGGLEHNAFFLNAAPFAEHQLARSIELADKSALRRMLEGAGFERVSVKSVRARVTVQSAQAYWDTLRGTLGIEERRVPASIAERARAPHGLPVEVVFALGFKHDPGAKQGKQLKRFQAVVAGARRQIHELTPYEVQRNLKNQRVVYLDVREEEAYLGGTIRGAVHVPRGEIEERLPQLLPDPKTPILTFCQRGFIGALAAARLKSMGYQNVWNLHGGLGSWKDNGLPVVSSSE